MKCCINVTIPNFLNQIMFHFMNFMNSTIFTRDIFVFGFPYIIFAKQKQKAAL